MVMRIGVIGFSSGNGHPFSFAAIVNGYDRDAFPAQWRGIRDYLDARAPQELGFDGALVTHAWMPDAGLADALRRACGVRSLVAEPADMIGLVDAVMILRDDWRSHWPLARPFLDAGIPVFVDKPLTASREEMEAFWPHLEGARLMSCSGLRFARELDPLRGGRERFGAIKLIRAAVVRDWTRYGIHMLEAALAALGGTPVVVQRHPAPHDSLAIALAEGPVLLIDALGAAPAGFDLAVHGEHAAEAYRITDNFSAFRRTIAAFLQQVETAVPAIAPDEVARLMATLRAGRAARPGGAAVAVA